MRVRYVFDAHFARALRTILIALGLGADHVFDRYGEGAKDKDFLPQLDTDHDVFVTYDKRIRTRPAEAFALQEAGVRALFLGPFWRGKGRWAQAAWVTANWPRVHEQVQQLPRGKWMWEESEHPKTKRPPRRGAKPVNPFPI